MNDILAPSIMCADLLNLEAEIKKLESAAINLIHFDVMDTTFTNQTMLPIMAIPMIKRMTDIPIDIHVMIDRPERIIATILPICKDAFISFHVESTMEIGSLIQQVRSAGGKPGVALNSATSVSMLEELIDHVDLINVILGNAGFGPRQTLDDQLLNKIRKIKKMINDKDRNDILLAVDGGVSFEVGRKTKEAGANTFVLGTKSIYIEEKSVIDQCIKFREYLRGESK